MAGGAGWHGRFLAWLSPYQAAISEGFDTSGGRINRADLSRGPTFFATEDAVSRNLRRRHRRPGHVQAVLAGGKKGEGTGREGKKVSRTCREPNDIAMSFGSRHLFGPLADEFAQDGYGVSLCTVERRYSEDLLT